MYNIQYLQYHCTIIYFTIFNTALYANIHTVEAQLKMSCNRLNNRNKLEKHHEIQADLNFHLIYTSLKFRLQALSATFDK